MVVKLSEVSQEEIDAFRASVEDRLDSEWFLGGKIGERWPADTAGALADAIHRTVKEATVAIENAPAVPVQVHGWWKRLWLALRGRQTWEMERLPGRVRVVVICPGAKGAPCRKAYRRGYRDGYHEAMADRAVEYRTAYEAGRNSALSEIYLAQVVPTVDGSAAVLAKTARGD